MALPSADLVQIALQNLYLAFTNDKTERGMRTAINHVNWLTGTLNFLYGVPVNIALTADDDDAGVSEFVAAESSISVGTIFRITSATPAWDFLDNALGTAKNAQVSDSVVAVGDIYVISGADAVVYLGNNSGIAFDNVGESYEDFMNIS